MSTEKHGKVVVEPGVWETLAPLGEQAIGAVRDMVSSEERVSALLREGKKVGPEGDHIAAPLGPGLKVVFQITPGEARLVLAVDAAMYDAICVELPG